MTTINKRRISNKRYSIESDSLTSFFINGRKNRPPPIYPNAQTGPTVTLTEFGLFFSAVILLVLAFGLFTISIWILFNKKYYDLFEVRPDLAIFALPVAFLTLPTSWLLIAIHNDEKSRKYLSLVLLLLLFCIILTILGIYLGFSHKLNLKTGQILSDPALSGFKESLSRSINKKNNKIWNKIETELNCCWVSCSNKNTTNCMEIMVSSLAFQTYVFSGIDCVALFLQSCVFLIVTVIFLCGKGHDGD